MKRLTTKDFPRDPEQGAKVSPAVLKWCNESGREQATAKAAEGCFISFLVTIASLLFLAAVATFGDVPDKGNNPYAVSTSQGDGQ